LLVPGRYSTRVLRLFQESNLFLSIAERPCDVTIHHRDIVPEHAAIVVGVPKQLRRGEKVAYRAAGNGKSGMIIGEAKDDNEQFEFTIEPFVTTGFLLSIRYSGDCHHNVTVERRCQDGEFSENSGRSWSRPQPEQ